MNYEILIKALEEISKQDDIELALDPQWAKRIAQEALKNFSNITSQECDPQSGS